MNANRALEPAAAGHPGQLARAVDQLLEAADWNEFDSTFRVGGGDIQAIVDANIVRLFMNPAGETRHLDVFELSTKRPDAQDYLTTFTAAAGEFMFLCKELKISGETRQLWKNPARIAPVHAEEMLLAIQHAARDARTFFDKEGVEAKARVEIEKLQAELPQFTKLNDDKQLQRVTEVTAALGRLFGPLLQLERYTSLLKSGDLAALAGHSLSTEQVLRPPYDLVEPWATALLHHKQQAPRTSKTPPSVAAANDARALVQVLLLNEAARMAGGKLRFVLISTDEGLHAVFKDFFDKGKVHGAPDRAAYVMRRPLQFGPMFNLRDMPNGFSERQPFERLKKSLQSAQKTVASSEGKVPLDASTISGIRDDWDSAMRTASVICSALAVRRFEALFRQLCSIRPGPEGIGALVALQERMLGQFEAGYLALDVQGLLANVAAAQERGSKAPGLSARRMPFMLHPAVFEPLGIISLDDFLNELWQSAAEPTSSTAERMNTLVAQLRERPPALVAFLAGVVGALTDHFDRSLTHLERAAELAKRPALGRLGHALDEEELNYLRAVVGRLRMQTEDDFQRARQLIDKLNQNTPDRSNTFNVARARAEAGTLRLVWAILPMLLHDPKTPRPARADAQWLPAGLHLLRQALGLLPMLTRNDSEEVAGRLPELITQVQTNIIAAIAVEAQLLLPGMPLTRTPSNLRQAFGPCLQALRRPPGDSRMPYLGDHIVGLWMRTALWLSRDKPAERRLAGMRLIQFCDARLKEMAGQLSDEHRGSIDEALFLRIRSRVGELALATDS